MKVFVDCGAWRGNSIVHFRSSRPDANEYKVYAFECFPDSIKELKSVNDIDIINAACWDKDTERTLRVGGKRFLESNTLVKSKKVKGYHSNNSIRVKCINLSKWIKDNLSKDDYIVLKMNIEGAEYKVLNKMIEDGTDKYINEFFVDWHYKKMDMSEETHLETANKINSKKWNLVHGKNVVYTVITDDKYSINNVLYKNPDWDYKCLTTLAGYKHKDYETVYLGGAHSKRQKLSRNFKILAHNYLKGYDASLYIDTRFTINQDLNNFVKNNLPEGCDIAVMKHNRRNCLYKEAEVLLKMGIFDNDNIKKQVRAYRKAGMPENFGLFAPGIMIRRHGSEPLNKMMRTWYEQMQAYSYRDMLSLAYAIWKHPEVNVHLMDFKSTYEGFMVR